MAPKNQVHSSDHHAPRQQAAARQDAPKQEAPAAAQAEASPAAPVPLTGLVLPLGVVTRSDISKSLRELQTIDDYFHQAAIRGSQGDAVPTLSRALDAVAQANKLNMIHADHRSALKGFLTKLKAQSPVVHLSFPSEASDPFIAKILEWFRTEVHPHIVLHVGLMPELAAGCQVRTTNKLFDFSLRKRFEQSKQKLMESLEALDKAEDHAPVAEANATVTEEARLT